MIIMKKIIGISIVTLFLGFSTTVQAQEEDKSTKQEIKKGAKKVGNKTAEVASKGKSKILDQQYKGKEGPNGETIYIDNKSKYYWVDKKGHKRYITEAGLKNKKS
jgi:ABC-type microcin C transport system permease subunit YejB